MVQIIQKRHQLMEHIIWGWMIVKNRELKQYSLSFGFGLIKRKLLLEFMKLACRALDDLTCTWWLTLCICTEFRRLVSSDENMEEIYMLAGSQAQDSGCFDGTNTTILT